MLIIIIAKPDKIDKMIYKRLKLKKNPIKTDRKTSRKFNVPIKINTFLLSHITGSMGTEAFS